MMEEIRVIKSTEVRRVMDHADMFEATGPCGSGDEIAVGMRLALVELGLNQMAIPEEKEKLRGAARSLS